jgi:hypothetical protein
MTAPVPIVQTYSAAYMLRREVPTSVPIAELVHDGCRACKQTLWEVAPPMTLRLLASWQVARKSRVRRPIDCTASKRLPQGRFRLILGNVMGQKRYGLENVVGQRVQAQLRRNIKLQFFSPCSTAFAVRHEYDFGRVRLG